MKWCRSRTSKKPSRSLKASKRIALAMAVAGLCSAGASAQTNLPSLPPAPQTEASSGEPELLPYPFPSNAAAQPRRSARVESQLIQMLGLSSNRRIGVPAHSSSASSCQQASCSEQTPSRSDSKAGHAVIIAAASAADSGSATPAIAEQGSESLIDIDIPLPMPTPSPKTGHQFRLTDSNLESPAKGGKQPPPSRKPEVVQRGVSKRLTIGPATIAAPLALPKSTKTPAALTRSTASSTIESQSLEPQAASQPSAEFHLSDKQAGASDRLPKLDSGLRSGKPSKPASVVSHKPRGMRVQIEGEPAMLIPAKRIQPSGEVRHEETRRPSAPTFEMATAPLPKPQPARVTLASKVAPASKIAPTNTTPVPIPGREMKIGEPLMIDRQGSASIITVGELAEFSAEHPSICRLIQSGEKTLSLIGLRPGTTRIAIVTRTDTGDSQVEIRSVEVGGGNTTQRDLSQLAGEISQTVAQLYPDSQVEIVAGDQQLVVQGTVDSEKDARKILSLVRKTALTPVVDRLQSYQR